MKFNTWRDPYDSGFSVTRPKEIEINQGITVLVGCNGAGKTTLLMNIKDELKKEKIPFHSFDNLRDGGSGLLGNLVSGMKEFECDSIELGISIFNASEGEAIKMNISRQSTLYKDFLETGIFNNREYRLRNIFSENKNKKIEDKRRFLLYDATDSGMSIDSVCEIKKMFEMLLEDAKKLGVELYIIITANEYELCRKTDCFDVNEGKYIIFEDYEEYRKFIIKSRERKEKRIEKQLKWLEEKRKKNEEKYNKLKLANNEKINKIEENAKKEGRELTHREKYLISDLQREIEDFKREKNISDVED